MQRAARKGLRRIFPLAAATIVAGVGTFVIGGNATREVQQFHSEELANVFASHLLQVLPHIDDIVTGKLDSTAASALVGSLPPLGKVVQFRLYDTKGMLRADSSLMAQGLALQSALTTRYPAAAAVLANGEATYHLEQGDGVGRPKSYSETMVPLIQANRKLGVLGVIADESRTWQHAQAVFENCLWQMMLLLAAVFAVPAILYFRKSDELESTAMRLSQSSQFDALTGTLNRATFGELLAGHVSRAEAGDLAVAVHVINLDRFKDINDARGHAAGDQLLKQAAARIRKCLGTREGLARLGGDEFAVAQPYNVELSKAVTDLAAELAFAMREPFMIGGKPVQISASVGYAKFPRDGRSVPDLMRAADIALHKAKSGKRGVAVAFDPTMEIERQARQQIETRLRHALVENDFEIHFQPLYEIEGRRLRGFEALLRLKHENGTPIPPAAFIPIAEEVGLIGDIGRWVLRESCRIARQWPEDLAVSVNLSPAQFAQGGMPRLVEDVLGWSGLPGNRLELEVTESLLITDTEGVLRQLTEIKALGPTIALDDFGTGYSSLSYLWQFPFDKLKVDKSFMNDITCEESKSREILSTIVALGRVLGVKVTAEGIETDQQLQILRELRCDLGQGYLLGRPMRAADVAGTILKSKVGLATWQEPPVPVVSMPAPRPRRRLKGAHQA